MRADLALILFLLTLAGGIALLVLRKKRGGAPLLIGGIVLLICAAALALYRLPPADWRTSLPPHAAAHARSGCCRCTG